MEYLPHLLGSSFDSVLMVYAFTVGLLTLLMHLLLAVGVYHEASDCSLRGRKLWFLGAGLWAFAALVGGIAVAGIYWVMHHSTLRPSEETDSDAD